MKTVAKLVAFICVLTLLLGCCSSAFADGKLSVYTAYPEEQAAEFLALFEKETGIDVEWVRLSAGEIYTRVAAEANNPQASIWWGTSAETFMVAAAEGLLETYESPALESIDSQFKSQDGTWSPFSLQIISYLVNEDWLAENGYEAPTSWDELITEKYKDNIVIAHPATSGMSYTWLYYMVQLMGEEEAFEYLHKLNDNIFQYAKSSNSPPRMVGMGECALTVAYTNQGMTNRDEGYPISITTPAEGTSYENSAMAIIKNGPADELENAKTFIDWALSKEAQGAFAKISYMIPVNSEAETPEGMVTLDQVNVFALDTQAASANRERLLNRFETEIRGKDNLA